MLLSNAQYPNLTIFRLDWSFNHCFSLVIGHNSTEAENDIVVGDVALKHQSKV